ncbi:MAG: MerR family transcriptional regulator [Eggerthellaceae bacterium]|nr:MerR family transcriptional regulator [Eggerthellaceae bacterium]
MYTVSQVALLAGVAAHTVRYYDERGLLVGVSRDAASYRIFDEEALTWFRLVVLLRACGVPLQDIEECVAFMSRGEDDAGRCRDMLEGFKHVLVGKAHEIDEMVGVLERMIKRRTSDTGAEEA